MDLYGSLFRSVLYPAWETSLRGRPTLARLKYLERTQWCSLDELYALQSAALRQLVRHAYDTVPYYSKRLRELHLRPEDIREPSDIVKLPLLEREDAAEHADARVATSGPKPTIRKGTSGSTGKPLIFGYEPDSEYWRQAIKLRGYSWAGYRPGDRSLHFWGAPTFPQPSALKRAKIAADHAVRRELVLPSTLRGDDHLKEVVKAVREFRPANILCYSQAGGDLGRFVAQNGARDWSDIPVICGAEKLFPHDRKALESAFGRGIFETYGSREVMLMAAECEAHDGQHVQMENILLEVVVREGGRVRSANVGEVGELVVTDLHNFAMPFLRYANGDLGVWAPPSRCSCGRSLVRLSSVEGRVTETLRDANGNAVGGLAYNAMFAYLAEAVSQFQIVQKKSGDITLKIVPTAKYSPKVEESIRKSHRAHFGELPLTIEQVQDIPLSKAGKRKPVIVER